MAISNLSGSADATLVKQATKAAAANIPGDYSDIHERISGAYAKEAEARGAMWSKAIEVVGKIGSDLVKKAKQDKVEEWNKDQLKFDEGTTTVDFIPGTENEDGMPEIDYDSEETTYTATDGSTFTTTDINGNVKPIEVMTTEEKLRDIRKQLTNLSWFKKNSIDPSTGQPWTKEAKKKEKQRLKNMRDGIRQSNIDFGAFQENMQTQIGQDNINTVASGMYNAEGMLFAQAMLAGGDPVAQEDPNLAAYDGARAIQGYDEKGNMIFTYVNKRGVPFKKDGKNITIAKGDLDSLVVPKSPKRSVFDTLVNDDMIKKNKGMGTRALHDQTKKVVNEQVTDKNTLLDLMFYHGGGTSSSLADSLNAIEYDNEGVASAKETPMFNMLMDGIKSISAGEQDKLDVSGDNKFTEADYNTQENLDKLIKKVLSGDNIQLGKTLLETHYKNAIDTRYGEMNPEVQQTPGMSADEARLAAAQAKIRDQNLAWTKINIQEKEKQQAEIDTQNTVYSIEQEFSRGDEEIGSGDRRAVFVPAVEATIVDGNEVPAQKAFWSLEANGEVKGTTPFGGAEALDEITKFVTKTGGKYGTFEIGKSTRDVTKDGVTTKYVYVGQGRWIGEGDSAEFPIKPSNKQFLNYPEEAEDGKYYINNDGQTYYFTKKDGYKEI